jgi:predicted transcriptional regulator of viral defense system
VKFTRLLEIVGDEPAFDSALLLAGQVDPADVRRQLSRWTKAGRLHQLRRGLYALAFPYQKVKPHPFVVANRLMRSSYVSLQSALDYYGLIPDVVHAVTSVTTLRPHRWETQLGVFEFHHIKTEWFFGYRQVEISPGQRAFVATPEKALLDLAYLHPGADDPAYLRELRLQNLERLNLEALQKLAEQSARPKLRRVAEQVAQLAHAVAEEYETL